MAERSENDRLLGALEDGLQMARARTLATAEARHDEPSSAASCVDPSAAGACPRPTNASDSQQQTADHERSAVDILTVSASGPTLLASLPA